MRLLTRSDFDGLVCGVVLKEAGIIDKFKFVHPKDIQDGIVEVTDNDVLANVPYVKGCKLWFDHHSSEVERLAGGEPFEGESRPAPSAARIIYDYYGGEKKFPKLAEIVKACDKVDSADLTAEDILNPKGWILLGFIMDPRTGLGRFRNFRISNLNLMEDMISACGKLTIDEILDLPDVKERVLMYFEQEKLFEVMIRNHTRVDANVIITDLRGFDPIYTGNRFKVYSVYPSQNISVWAVDGKNKQNCSIAVGRSIINKTSNTDVGSLLLKYGGGGHKAVGTCQVPYADADRVIDELVGRLKSDG